MTRDLVVGIESGPSDTTAVAFDREGVSIAEVSVPRGERASIMGLLGSQVTDLGRRTLAVAWTEQGEAAPLATTIAENELRCTERKSRDAAFPGLDPAIPHFDAPAALLSAAVAAGLLDGTGAGCSVLDSEEAHLRMADASPGTVQIAAQAGPGLCWLVDVARDLMADFDRPRSRREMLAGLDAGLATAAPGGLLFETDALPATVPRDARAHLFGLSTRHGFDHLARAIVEHFAFAAHVAFGLLAPADIRLAGVGSSSATVQTILASITRTHVCALRRDRPAAAGAALLVAFAIGQETNVAAASARWVKPYLGPVTLPDSRLADIYDRLGPAIQKASAASVPVRAGLEGLPVPKPRSTEERQGLAHLA